MNVTIETCYTTEGTEIRLYNKMYKSHVNKNMNSAAIANSSFLLKKNDKEIRINIKSICLLPLQLIGREGGGPEKSIEVKKNVLFEQWK